MTVLDVVLIAIKILGDLELYNYLTGEGDEQEIYLTDKELLLLSYNKAIQTAINYCPLYHTETLTPISGAIKYERFAFDPYKIVKVISKDNSKTKIHATEIISDSEITVEYIYIPTVKGFDEKFVFMRSPLTALDVSYGVLSEYLLYKGRFEEANAYFDKFLTALKNAGSVKRYSNLKARTWF